MSQKKKLKPKVKRKIIFGFLALGIIPIILIGFLAGWLFLTQRIYPNIKVAGVDVGLLTREQAFQKLTKTLSERGNGTLEFAFNSRSTQNPQKFTVALAKQETAPSAEKGITEAFKFGRSKTYFLNMLRETDNVYFPGAKIELEFSPSLSIKTQIENIAESVNQEAINSSLKIFDGEITVTPSQEGLILDEQKIYAILNDYLNGTVLYNTELPLKIQEPELNFTEASTIKKRLDEIKNSPIKLTFEDINLSMDLSTVLSLVDLENSKDSLFLVNINNQKFNIGSVNINGEEVSDSKLTLNQTKLEEYLKTVSDQIDREVQEPLFSVDPASDPGKPKITEFRPPQVGRKLNIQTAADLISYALINSSQTEIKLPVEIIEPKNKLTNELGIKELIGRGVSHFTGSIENRKFNIGLATSKINGMLIAPGEEFSFVNTVGDISAATGFKQAYVIKSGRTVLDDGGGVCQVSTTVFRAALNTGLPITARTAHAYRVGYYEQGFPPGLDATIFHPSVDLKFKNDTDKHILIQAYVTGNTLTVDLYGTSDGRTIAITKPVILNVTPAPPEIRQDDPTLPKGTVKQVDWAAAGANVSFKRTVTKGGITYIDETFKSNFRPWQAVYLVGTKEG